MSDVLIANLQKRLEELTTENASLKAENKDRRVKTRKATEELDQLKKDLGTLTTERDTLKTSAEAKPGELQAKIGELEGQIRTRDHRDAFASVGEFAVVGTDGKSRNMKLADGVKIDAVWQLTQYKAEGETPDAKAISERLGQAVTAHPFLFSEVAAPGPGGPTRPITLNARESGPGGGKGTESPTVTAASRTMAASTVNSIPGRI